MERPTRRSAAAAAAAAVAATANGTAGSHHASHNSHSNNNSHHNNSSSRRRRRGADDEKLNGAASASDGADTDSSSTVVESSTTRASGRKTTRASRATGDNNAADDDELGPAASDDDTAARAGRSTRANGRKELDATESPHRDGSADDDEAENASQEDSAPVAIMTRSRRERSQSVVSTTSDTSSIVSEAVEEDASVSHEEKLHELEKKKKMVEDGTLAEFCRRVAEFKEERNRLLQTAEWHKNLQVKNIQDLYGFEMQRARNIWSDRKDELKNAMLSKTDALLAKLQKEMELLEKTGELPRCLVIDRSPRGHPTLKIVGKDATAQKENDAQTPDAQPDVDSSDAEKSEALPPTGAPLKRRKIASTSSVPASAPVPDNVLRLPLDDITADLASIVQTREQNSSKVQSMLSVPARLDVQVERRRLTCGKYVFEEGDEVVVTATVLREDYIGVITSVATDELFVKLSTGQKARILVEHLARRRCEIRPFLRGSAGLESLHATGWVECEPF
ncbi:hypothetical protein PINS_up007745 [Pythium insidiosum]|nr:hypothetical protein PINS_up007745 [Pythium insidiosum]